MQMTTTNPINPHLADDSSPRTGLLVQLSQCYPDGDLLLLHFSALTRQLTAIGTRGISFTLSAEDTLTTNPFSLLLPSGNTRSHASLLRSGLMQIDWLKAWWHALDPLLAIHIGILDEEHLLLMAGRPKALRLWQQDPRIQSLARHYLRAATFRPMITDADECQVHLQRLTGQSSAVTQLRHELQLASRHRLTVLLQGETGTGKEIAARLIHDLSSRHAAPFLAINCAAIPENLVESELFGHVKGAFSGAIRDQTGLLEQANGGTLFLDEIGDMPLGMQIKLLRVLETRQLRALGARHEITIDLRLVAASHKSLPEMVNNGSFRADLFHRLSQCQIQLPALRYRREDLPALCRQFTQEHSSGRQQRTLDAGLQQALGRYPFPGNIRELRNLIAIACAMTPDSTPLSLQYLPETWRQKLECHAQSDPYGHIKDIRLAVQQFEAAVIDARLHRFTGNRQLVAASLGLPKRTLDNKCRKLGLK